MPNELLVGGLTNGYSSEKLPQRDRAFSREFRLGIVTGKVSDGDVLQDGELVGYIVEIDGDTPRRIKIDPKQLDGILGEELAVRRAQEQRSRQLLGNTIMKGKYG